MIFIFLLQCLTSWGSTFVMYDRIDTSFICKTFYFFHLALWWSSKLVLSCQRSTFLYECSPSYKILSLVLLVTYLPWAISMLNDFAKLSLSPIYHPKTVQRGLPLNNLYVSSNETSWLQLMTNYEYCYVNGSCVNQNYPVFCPDSLRWSLHPGDDLLLWVSSVIRSSSSGVGESSQNLAYMPGPKGRLPAVGILNWNGAWCSDHPGS